MLIGDKETDGLLATVTKIHCAVFYETDTDTWTEFTPENMEGLIPFLESQPKLCMHNGIGFDLKILKKLYDYEYKGQFYDTLLMSRILWPDKECNTYRDEKGNRKKAKKPHSVENWGIEFNIAKPVHEDWTVFSPEMLHRCREDVKIQTLLYKHVQKYIEMLQYKDKRIGNLQNVLNLELKVWRLMEKQADTGWAFDIDKAYLCVEDLETQLKAIDDELIPTLPTTYTSPIKGDKNKVVTAFTKSGIPTVSAFNWVGEKIIKDNLMGDFCKVVKNTINLGSSAQVKDYLLSVGWKPTVYNYKKDQHNKKVRDERGRLIKTSPKIPDTVEAWTQLAAKLKNPAVTLMATRGMIKHRLGVIKGLIKNVRADLRIEARANSCSTNTARMSHQIVVNIPKANSKEFYGVEMRSLFKASEGKVQVGCDASALEARCEAHYIYKYDPEAARELLEGDIHTKNAEVFGTDRQTAKSGKYAILYGCSASRLAETINKPLSQAKEIYEAYWAANPALLQFRKDLELEWKRYGYLLSIDGRPLTVRYEHALVNTKLQSCGAVIMKVALCYADKYFQQEQIAADFVGNFHDEMQTECLPEYSATVGDVLVKSMESAGRALKLNVPITGEYKVGNNWSETH